MRRQTLDIALWAIVALCMSAIFALCVETWRDIQAIDGRLQALEAAK